LGVFAYGERASPGATLRSLRSQAPAMPKGIGAGRGGTGCQRGDGGRRRRWRESKRTAGYDDDCHPATGKPVEPDGNRALFRREPVGNVSLPVGGSDNLTSAESAGRRISVFRPPRWSEFIPAMTGTQAIGRMSRPNLARKWRLSRETRRWWWPARTGQVRSWCRCM